MKKNISLILEHVWFIPCLTGLLTWIALLQGLYPSLHWYDTGEWVATPRMLSLAHPPGHPFTVLSTHFMQLIPWFDAYTRANLASALWLSLASGLTARTMLLLTGHSHVLTTQITAGCVGLLVPALPFAWLQGVRAEVYAPQCALVAMTLYFWGSYLDSKDLRWLLCGGMSIGLQATNHTLLALAIMGPFLLWLMIGARYGVQSFDQPFERSRISLKAIALTCGMSIGGLSLYLFIGLRGQAGGIEGWGWIDDFSSFWDTLSARVWQQAVMTRSTEVLFFDNLTKFSAFIMMQLGLTNAFVTLGLVILALMRWIKKRCWEVPLTLFLVCISVALTKLTYPFVTINPDFSGYLVAAAPAFCLLIGLSCFEVTPRFSSAVMSLILLGASSQDRLHGSAQSYYAESWVRATSEEVPLTGALWTSHYATHFGLSALRIVEGWRPDLALIFRGHRHQSWFLSRLNASRPALPLSQFDAFQPRVRFEVEGALDVLPELRSQARIQGLTWGLMPWVEPISLKALRLRLDETRRRGREQGQIHIDTIYAMALYHEEYLWWLKRGPSLLSLETLEEFVIFHLSERDAWLKTLP